MIKFAQKTTTSCYASTINGSEVQNTSSPVQPNVFELWCSI